VYVPNAWPADDGPGAWVRDKGPDGATEVKVSVREVWLAALLGMALLCVYGLLGCVMGLGDDAVLFQGFSG
jgi:hypothetical protein